MIKTLTCVDCRVEFTYDHRKGPTRQRCDTCTAQRKKQTDSAKAQRWRQADPDRYRKQAVAQHERRKAQPGYRQYHRERNLWYNYRLTPAELDAMVAAQGGVCAICGGGPNGPGSRLHIDHCHDSKKVRGLLCGKCNTAVGLLDDDPMRAEQLARYLRQ